MRFDGQTDRKLIIAFRNFAKALKKFKCVTFFGHNVELVNAVLRHTYN